MLKKLVVCGVGLIGDAVTVVVYGVAQLQGAGVNRREAMIRS